MKKLENKTTEIANGEEKLTYAGLLKIVLMVTPQGGYSLTDMKTRLKLTDLLEKANGEIELEDADYTYLKPLLSNMKWGVVNKGIIELCDDFEKAEKK